MFRRAVIAALVVGAAATVAMQQAGEARSDGTSPVADVSVSLSGPSAGNVGDVLTYTVTATNHGPDVATTDVSFFMETGRGLAFVSSTPACGQQSVSDGLTIDCGSEPIAAGQSLQLSVQARVTQIVETTLNAIAVPGPGDPDTTNNGNSIVVLTPPAAAPATPPAPSGPSAPPYSFVGNLPPATEWQPYLQKTITCPTGCGPQQVVLVSGDLPPGIVLDADGTLEGSPETSGQSTITLEADPLSSASETTIQQTFTLTVLAGDGQTDSSGTDETLTTASAWSPPPPPSWWTSCTTVWKRYPHGVGRLKAVDKTRGRRVKNFKRSVALYRLATRHNKHLDPDHDGIACEKR